MEKSREAQEESARESGQLMKKGSGKHSSALTGDLPWILRTLHKQSKSMCVRPQRGSSRGSWKTLLCRATVSEVSVYTNLMSEMSGRGRGENRLMGVAAASYHIPFLASWGVPKTPLPPQKKVQAVVRVCKPSTCIPNSRKKVTRALMIHKPAC